MLEKYMEKQEIVTKLLMQSLKEDKIVQAYLFCCDDIEYIYNYAKDFAKDIISKSNLSSEVLESINKRIDLDEYTELKVISPEGNYIKKEQLIDLQNQTLNKPVEGNKIIYIIRNCEKLNASSANSILKFLEEPEEDIIAILLTNNLNMVIPTITSRCQVLNFNSVKGEKENSLSLLINDEDYPQEYIDNLVNSSVEALSNIENKKKNTFIFEKDLFFEQFQTNNDILIMLNIFMYSYMDALNKKLDRKVEYMKSHISFIDDIADKNSIDQITKKINKLEAIKFDVRMNANIKLLFDRLIIELSEV